MMDDIDRNITSDCVRNIVQAMTVDGWKEIDSYDRNCNMAAPILVFEKRGQHCTIAARHGNKMHEKHSFIDRILGRINGTN